MHEEKKINENNIKEEPSQIKIIDETATKKESHDNANELLKYIENHVIGKKRFHYPKCELILKVPPRLILAGFGGVMGLPWTSASASASIIFPQGWMREFGAGLFIAGIVVNVGAESAWVMSRISKRMEIMPIEEKKLLDVKSKTMREYFKDGAMFIVPIVLAGIACISPVYAAVKYSEGSKQLLAIITLVGESGNGVFAYHALLLRFINAINWISNSIKGSKVKEKNNLINIRNKLIISLEKEMSKRNNPFFKNFNNFSNGEDFIYYLLRKENYQQAEHIILKIIRNFFKYIPATLIAGSSATVDFFLVKDFLQNKIFHNPYVSYPGAVIAATPKCIITFIATSGAFESIFELISKCRGSIVDEVFPVSRKILSLLLLGVALGAPTAAAYIAYTTLTGQKLPVFLAVLAASSLVMARYSFANFALNRLAESFISWCADIHSNNRIANYSKIEQFKSFLPVVGLKHFSLFEKQFIEHQNEQQPLLINGNPNSFLHKDSKKNEKKEMVKGWACSSACTLL